MDSTVNYPTGGFPPIYINDDKTKKIEEKKVREFTTKQDTVSIKDILKERRNVKPFL